MTKLALILTVLMMALASPAAAISPEEVMADVQLEERARAISKQLRCLVCQNQSIDDSDADLARDLRREVRLQLSMGKSDDAIFDHLRNRYGDYVLLNPPVTPLTYVLWGLPLGLCFLGAGIFALTRRPIKKIDAIIPRDDLAANDAANNAPVLKWFGLGGAVVVVSLGLYAVLGRPDLPSQPLSIRTAEIAIALNAKDQQNAENSRLLRHAKAEADGAPSSVEAQLNYAMHAARVNDNAAEHTALSRALALTDNAPSITAMLAESMSRAAGGMVTLPARALIDQVLAVDPDEPRARYLKGLAAYQDENHALAISIWAETAEITNPADPLASVLAANITAAAKAGGIPLQGRLAEFTDINQAERINAMVASLEARLDENPNDIDGWARLIQSRRVLDNTIDLMRALINAAAAQPNDLNAQIIVLEEMLERDIGAEYLSQADVIINRIKTINPDGLELLFFAGHFAALSGKNNAAAEIWTELLEKLPADAPFKPFLLDEINALKNQH